MSELKIMLCDDSLLVRKKLKDALNELGFSNVIEATDGEEAVALFKQERPELVLMDIVMPKMDGITALSEIKTLDPSAHVVMVSSVGTQGKLMNAIKLGANNFLQKPVNPSAIVEIAKKLMVKRGDQ